MSTTLPQSQSANPSPPLTTTTTTTIAMAAATAAADDHHPGEKRRASARLREPTAKRHAAASTSSTAAAATSSTVSASAAAAAATAEKPPAVPATKKVVLPAKEAPQPPETASLPTKVVDGKPLPTRADLLGVELPDSELQSIGESNVLATSLARSRHRWLHGAILDRFWSKATYKKKKDQTDAADKAGGGGKGKEAKEAKAPPMTKLGACRVVVDPHIFDVTVFYVRDTTQPAQPVLAAQPKFAHGRQGAQAPPATQPKQPAQAAAVPVVQGERQFVQYGPPGVVVGVSGPYQAPKYQSPVPRVTGQKNGSVGPLPQGPPTAAASAAAAPKANGPGTPHTPTAHTPAPHTPAPMPAMPAVPAMPAMPVETPSAKMKLENSDSQSQTPLHTQQRPSPAAVAAPLSHAAALAPPVGAASTPANIATSTPRIAATSSPANLAAPTPRIAATSTPANASQSNAAPRAVGTSTPSRPSPFPPPKPQSAPKAAANPAPQPTNDPVIHMLAQRASTDYALKQVMKIVASGQATPAQLEYFQKHIDELTKIVKDRHAEEERKRNLVVAQKPPLQQSKANPPYQSTPTRPPNQQQGNFKSGTNGAPSFQAGPPAGQQQQRYYAPHPPIPKPRPVAVMPAPLHVLLEFAQNSTDRFLFPRNSILEYAPSGTSLLATFLIIKNASDTTADQIGEGKKTQSSKKNDAKTEKVADENPNGEEQRQVYQPITIRLESVSDPSVLNIFSRVVAPVDEVRKYMIGVAEKYKRADTMELAMRLPRESRDAPTTATVTAAAGAIAT